MSRQDLVLALAVWLAQPVVVGAQTTFHVSTEGGLSAALSSAQNGDAILFDSTITLTGDLPAVQRSIVIDGAGHALSGGDQFRGLFVAAFAPGTAAAQPVDVTIRNLTIRNTRAAGGDGGGGTLGGGGGAGLGGALFVASRARVTLANVNVVANRAAGGSGGDGGLSSSGGGAGGGGLGGDGGLGDSAAGGGGGGVGPGATGGYTDAPGGGAGILASASSGGSSSAAAGGAAGGGGATGGVDRVEKTPEGGAGGGAGGAASAVNAGGAGGFGGGGGGATPTGISASGGFGGGGGGGTGGTGGFGGGGAGGANSGGFGGGAGSAAGGGGGAGMGGAVFVQDGGVLTIAGASNVGGNAVSGGTGASGGANGGAFGSGLFLNGHGTLDFVSGAGQTQAVADAIADQSGNGGGGLWGVVKDGAGTLVLSGANSFGGGVTVNAGTLSVGSDSNLGGGGALTLTSGATLAITASGGFARSAQLSGAGMFRVGAGQAVAWSGRISNGASAGTLLLGGGGTLSLANGTNSYSGGTFVLGGSTLAVDADSALGAPEGSLTLGDARSTGALRIADAVLFDSSRLVGLGAGGGIIDTVGSSSATFSTPIGGEGGLTKRGTGTLTLNGAQAFTGPTGVEQGAFVLNGSVPGSVVVYPDGSFSGAGTIGGSLTIAGAAVESVLPQTAGAASVGRIGPRGAVTVPTGLVVRGDLVVLDGATLTLALTSTSQTALLAEGHGIVLDANLDLQVNDPAANLERVTTYSALTALNGLSVANPTITSNIAELFPDVRPYLSLDKTTLRIVLVNAEVPLETAATTRNGEEVAGIFDRLEPAATGDRRSVKGELELLGDEALDEALKEIAGEVHGSRIRLVALDAEAFTDLVRAEISTRQRTTEDDLADASFTPRGQRPQWWGQLDGQHVVFDENDLTGAADANIGSAAFGMDWNFAGRWFAGGGGGYSRGRLALDTIDASSRVTAPRAFGYAGFTAGPWSLNFGGSGAWTSSDTRRRIAFGANVIDEPIPGGVDRTAASSQEGVASDAWTELADTFRLRSWTYDAKVGWRHARYGAGAWQETGAQSLSLEAAAQAEHSTQADVKIKVFRHEGSIRPHGAFTYRRELGEAGAATDVHFADDEASGFSVDGLGFGTNTATGQGGVTVRTASGLEYTLEYEARHAAGQTAQSVHFRLRYK